MSVPIPPVSLVLRGRVLIAQRRPNSISCVHLNKVSIGGENGESPGRPSHRQSQICSLITRPCWRMTPSLRHPAQYFLEGPQQAQDISRTPPGPVRHPDASLPPPIVLFCRRLWSTAASASCGPRRTAMRVAGSRSCATWRLNGTTGSSGAWPCPSPRHRRARAFPIPARERPLTPQPAPDPSAGPSSLG